MFGNFPKTLETVQKCFSNDFMVFKFLENLRKYLEIFRKLQKQFKSVFQMFLEEKWPSKLLHTSNDGKVEYLEHYLLHSTCCIPQNMQRNVVT